MLPVSKDNSQHMTSAHALTLLVFLIPFGPLHSVHQYGQLELSKSKSFLWLLLTLRTDYHTLVEEEPM